MNAPDDRRENLRSRLAGIRDRINSAAEDSGHDPDAVELIAVTKGFDRSIIELAREEGLGAIGENRVRTAVEKKQNLPDAVVNGLEWHMIGHVQSNKVKYLIGEFDLIHSVDRDSLINELEKRLSREGLRQDVLLQVNVSGEDSKHGATPEAAPAVLESILETQTLDPRGLMTMAPRTDESAVLRETFASCRRLRDDLSERFDTPLPELSMGMTNDYLEAVAEGSTMVRVGRGLFGERPD